MSGKRLTQVFPFLLPLCKWQRKKTDKDTGKQTERELYVNQCEIAYKLPEGTKIQGGGIQNG